MMVGRHNIAFKKHDHYKEKNYKLETFGSRVEDENLLARVPVPKLTNQLEVEDLTRDTIKYDELQDDQQLEPELSKEKLDIIAKQTFSKQQTFKEKGSSKWKMILWEPT